MPPRFAYWTIILDGTPTSFRTKEREDILPLFNQLRAKNPAALLKWFSGGRLWDSPEQAKEVRNVEKVRRFREERSKETKEQREVEEREMAAFREKHGRPADGSDQPQVAQGAPAAAVARPRDGEDPLRSRGASAPREGRPPSDRRSKDWRPGGEHRDPRDKYKLPPGEARKRWKDRNLGPRVPKPFGPKPEFRSGGASAPPKAGDRPFGDRPRGDRPYGGKPFGGPPSSRDGGDRSFRPGKPFGSKPGGDRPWGDRPRGPKPEFRKDFRSGGASAPPKAGDRPFGDRPRGDRPYGGKPFGGPPSSRDGGERSRRPGKPFGSKPGGKPFGAKPGGGRPFGSKPGGPRRKG